MSVTARAGAARWVALIALEVLIGIHAALTPMHLEEMFYIGVLFAIGNAAFFLAMLFMISKPLRLLGWLLGTATCVVEFGGFIASRTLGLPHGYKETWIAEPEDLLGLACLFVEIVFVALAAYSWRALATGATGRRAGDSRATVGSAARAVRSLTHGSSTAA